MTPFLTPLLTPLGFGGIQMHRKNGRSFYITQLILVPSDVELNNDRVELILVPSDVELDNDRVELILVPSDGEFPLVYKQ